MEWFDKAPLWLIGVALTLVLVAAEELGVRARRVASRSRGTVAGDADNGVSSLVGAALGLLALIFGFTYAMAQERYDQRRALVMAEARAVVTSYLRYQALDEPDGSQLGRLMGEYTALRSQAIDPQVDQPDGRRGSPGGCRGRGPGRRIPAARPPARAGRGAAGRGSAPPARSWRRA